jgi:tRNA-2-methylthio-N6-dimethylallyladenosine synthase
LYNIDMKTFFIKSFGCQYNEWDAIRYSYLLDQIGLQEIDDPKKADVVIALNCSVRKTAVDRALGFFRNLDPDRQKLIVTACILPKDKERFKKKGVSLWDLNNISQLTQILKIDLPEKGIEKVLCESQELSYYIPIMSGCNNFCTYCAVPYVRGREYSRPFNEVIANVKQVIGAGHHQVWLLGQNVNSYKYDFAKLLAEIDKIPGDFQIYFTSNHPKDMSDEIIRVIAKDTKIAKQIHLPLQSGSNKILKAMNRPYTKDQYLKLIEKIKKQIPDVRFVTDVIVGFPGETQKDFQETVSVFKKVKYFQAYINKYSPREGTAAFKLGDPIPWTEKERRWRILNEIANK